MKKLNILTMSDKGGVSKTTNALGLISTARHPDFAHHVRQDKEAIKVAAFSADPENTLAMKLLRGPGDPFTSMALHNINRQEGIENLLNVLEEVADAGIVITDFPSNSLKVLGKIVDAPKEYFGAFEEAGFTNYVLIPLDEHPDTIQSLQSAMSRFGTQPSYIISFRPNETDPNDYSKSRSAAYLTLAAKLRKEGARITEWEFPLISGNMKAFAHSMNLAYYDEALALSMPMVDRIRLRKGHEKVIEFYRELYK